MSICILAIDTTTDACSVALMLKNNDIIFKRFSVTPRKHMKYILSMIDSVLSEADISLKVCDVIAFGKGPGNFSGVRISINVAQGLTLGTSIPLIGISTLSILAEGAWRIAGARKVLIAIDACINKIYWSAYQRQMNGVWLGEDHEKIIEYEKIKELHENLTGSWVMVGTGWKPDIINQLPCTHSIEYVINNQILFPDALDMLPIAKYQYLHGYAKPIEQIQLTYLYNNMIVTI